MFPFIISKKNKNVTVFIGEKPYVCEEKSEKYPDLINAIKNGDEDFIKNFFKEKTVILENFSYDGSLKFDSRKLVVTLDGVTVPRYVSEQLVKMKQEGFNTSALEAFVKRLMQNPSESSRSQLYEFMEAGNMPITEDGHFIAYKMVRENYKDIYTGKFDNSIGSTPSMPRESVNDNRNETCSHGLHFCSKEYLKSGFGSGTNRLMIVKIDPIDVVSIPKDYNNSKGRCCRYEVIGEITHDDVESHEKNRVFVETKEESGSTVETKEESGSTVETASSDGKVCNTCNVEKPFTEFYKDAKSKDGHKGRCKECTKASKGKTNAKATLTHETNEKSFTELPGAKHCNKCGELKSLDDFHKDSKSKDGHKGQCKICVNEARSKKK